MRVRVGTATDLKRSRAPADYTTRINVNNIMRKGNVIKPVEVVTVYAEE